MPVKSPASTGYRSTYWFVKNFHIQDSTRIENVNREGQGAVSSPRRVGGERILQFEAG